MHRFPLVLLASLLVSLPGESQIPIAAPEKRPAFRSQGSVAVAGSGHDFLAAWADLRSMRSDPPYQGSSWVDIYATRIRLDGTDVSDGGVPINPSEGSEDRPAVIWNGTEYVVINPMVHWTDGSVAFTRVLPDRLTQPVVVPATVKTSGWFDAAWNGRRYLALLGSMYGPQPEESVLRLLLLTSDFDLVTPEFPLSSAAFFPAVAGGESGFLVAWMVERAGGPVELHATVIADDGTVGSDVVIASFDRRATIPASAPAVVWNGSRYFVVWSDGATLRGRHIDAAGNPVDQTFTLVSSSDAGVIQPAVAWNGSMYLISFSDRNEPVPALNVTTNLYAVRVSPEGSLIDWPQPLVITTSRGANAGSAVAASGSAFLVSWEEGSDVWSSVVDAPTGSLGPLRVVARSIWWQMSPDGVYDGSNLGFLWGESGGQNTDMSLVVFGRVTPHGQHLDGGGIELGTGTPGAIAAADIYVATWEASGTVRAIRISKQGELLDPEPLRIPTPIGVLGTDGSAFLYIGTERIPSEDGSYTRRVLRSWRMGPSGALSPASEVVPAAEFDQVPLDIAWNGSQYLLLYHQLLNRICHRCVLSYELRMVALDSAGRPVSQPVVLASEFYPTGVVAGGDGLFIVAVNRLGRDEYYVIGPDAGVLSSGYTDFRPTDAAWDGRVFHIIGVTSESRGGIDTYRAFHQRVAPTGEIVSRTKFGNETHLPVWRLVGSPGRVAVIDAYVERMTQVHSGGIPRLRFSWIEPRRRAVAR